MRPALLTVVAVLVVGMSAAAASAAPHPLVTAVYFDRADVLASPLAYHRVKSAGASVLRITISWRTVAPATEPSSWDPSNPDDSNYQWGQLDSEVKRAVAAGLDPLLTIFDAPSWAQQAPAVPQPNSRLPDPTALAHFATAVATRYGGSHGNLPRVRYWQAWNEPNLSIYLVPQLVNRKPVSPAWYRKMLNAFADAVHGVHSDNVVVAGGLAPFRDITQAVVKQDKDWGPLSFMRDLLCLSASLRPTCSTPTEFDAWAQHPYTSGGPTHHAVLANDVSLGDLYKVRRVLDAAKKYHHIVSHGPLRFWVTEFSWDTRPPDPKGVPLPLATRWTAEALYRMWANGVSLVTWLMLRDDPGSSSYLQSGLYFAGSSLSSDQPKPLLAAFRFPVVGLPQGKRVYVWGRTPGGVPGLVTVQWRSGSHWEQLATLHTDRYGIFQGRYSIGYTGWVRARFGRSLAPAFRLADVPDHFYNPFGATFLFEPHKKP